MFCFFLFLFPPLQRFYGKCRGPPVSVGPVEHPRPRLSGRVISSESGSHDHDECSWPHCYPTGREDTLPNPSIRLVAGM
ncbi:hypothetical protein GGS23DRAFT_590790, partial [Durotheca rogersii]|uniref:uncharacterized protein n=1 Tax=Durotheca rogersii TaxID=419775 RepID=UPI002220E29B